MAENALAAENREQTGKGVARKLRAAGRIPAVLYGQGMEPAPLSVDPMALNKVLQASGAGRNTLIGLEVGANKHTVLLKDLQRNPVNGVSLHADFLVVDLTATVEVTVQLHFVGQAKGLDFGGILDHPVRELHVQCLPNAIPEFLEVDVSSLDLGETLHVHEVELPSDVVCMNDGELAVAICVQPRAVVEETPEEAEVTEEGAEAADGDAPAPDGDS